jgi:hypothetical protein
MAYLFIEKVFAHELDYDEGELESSEETTVFLVMPTDFRTSEAKSKVQKIWQ